MESQALDLVMTGRVQGVFFRAAMREQAQHLGVTGWARNEPDGTVRAHVEGPEDALETLLEWCAVGPPAARVEQVRKQPSEARGATSFDVS